MYLTEETSIQQEIGHYDLDFMVYWLVKAHVTGTIRDGIMVVGIRGYVGLLTKVVYFISIFSALMLHIQHR